MSFNCDNTKNIMQIQFMMKSTIKTGENAG